MLDLKTIFDPDRPTRAAIALPEPPSDNVSPWDLEPEWLERWQERAAIMEYDAKMPKEHAEALALTDTLRQMQLAGTRLPKPST